MYPKQKYLETDGVPWVFFETIRAGFAACFGLRRDGVGEPKAVSRFVPLVAAFLAGLILVLGAVVYLAGPSASPIGPGGPFHLEDQTGRPVRDQDMKGRPYLVFFGYTHCPDVCPTTLFEISEVMKALGKDADRAAALFITVDPQRDTPAVITRVIASLSL